MKKRAFEDAVTTATINGYVIRTFTWTMHEPDNINTASISVVYDLAFVGDDGSVTRSTLPGQGGITFRLYNVGDDQRLTAWLESSGKPDDLMDFNYHDVERLIEVDIQTRFGVQLNKK